MGYTHRTGKANPLSQPPAKSKPQGDGHEEAENDAADKQSRTLYNKGKAQMDSALAPSKNLKDNLTRPDGVAQATRGAINMAKSRDVLNKQYGNGNMNKNQKF